MVKMTKAILSPNNGILVNRFSSNFYRQQTNRLIKNKASNTTALALLSVKAQKIERLIKVPVFLSCLYLLY